MSNATIVAAAVALLAALPMAATGRAAESPPHVTARATASLVSDRDSIAPGQPVRLALRLRLAEGWHTYWRNPGDAGVAPNLEFALPAGVRAGPIAWPTPLRLTESGLVTYGYTGDVLLPVTLSGASGAMGATLHADWLVCANICVPEEADFRLDLPAGNGAPSPQAGLFAQADARTPRPSPWSARLGPDGTLDVAGADLGPGTVRAAAFLADAPDRIADTAQSLSVRPGGLRLGLRLAPGATATAKLTGVLTLRDGAGQDSAYAVTALPGALPPLPPDDRATLPRALLLALLGGLVLNLMPCVFPILALKAASLAARRDAASGRALAASYTAGVVLSFAAIGSLLIALRSAGDVAGWGFQFQIPAFVAATAWVLFLVGLNFSGVFAVGGGRWVGVGQSATQRGGHAGSFATGVLAVLVATPCTAPFMAVAVTAALAAPPLAAVSVFAALGLGLAAPYLLLAWLPGAARLLPRPGAWMEMLRQVLAFPMYAAAAWLAWVLSLQAGPDGVALLGGGFVLLGLAAWAIGRAQRSAGARWRRGAMALAGVALLGSIALLPRLRGAAAAAESGLGATGLAGLAEPYSAERLASLRAAGRPVFVDMTAAWCVTCLVNERVALSPAPVRAAFAAGHVALLRGDWTRQDAGITAFLRGHDRDGVPLYVLFPAAGAPVVLPQILTPGTVLAALKAT